jgi:hypothetical protein
MCDMDSQLVKKIRSDLAREGGKARALALTAAERKAIAVKASKAAARARTALAKQKKVSRTAKARKRDSQR